EQAVALHNALGCVRWLGKYVDGAFGTEFENGLFRVRAADSVSAELKHVMGLPEGLPYQKLCVFVSEQREKVGIVECANAISSFLKAVLRNLPEPMLSFDFCTKDLREFKLENVTDDIKRSEVGMNLAQDIIHEIVLVHRECSDELITVLVSLTAQLFSLLCSVTRNAAFNMDSYDLFVPFLPSVCGSRDPMQLIKEHNSIKSLNEQRRNAEVEGRAPPMTRLEVMVVFGHRIWGYTKLCLPTLPAAIDALRKVDAENTSKPDGAAVPTRKRDILKRILKKPKEWFHSESSSPANASMSSSHAKAQDAPGNYALPPGKQKPQTVASLASTTDTKGSYVSKENKVFREDPKIHQPDRVKSMRILSSSSDEQPFPLPLPADAAKSVAVPEPVKQQRPLSQSVSLQNPAPPAVSGPSIAMPQPGGSLSSPPALRPSTEADRRRSSVSSVGKELFRRVGARHWEENFVVPDWSRRLLVAHSTQADGERAMLRDEAARQEADLEDATALAGTAPASAAPDASAAVLELGGGLDVDEEDAAPSQGSPVCELARLEVEVADSDVQAECKAVTGGDYGQVLVLKPQGTDMVCMLGIEEHRQGLWERWLDNLVSLATFLERRDEEHLDDEELREMVRELKITAFGRRKIKVDGPETFETAASAAAFAELLNMHMEELAIHHSILDGKRGYDLFGEFERCRSLRRLVLSHCALHVGFLCKGLLCVSAHLEELELVHCDIGDDGAAAVCEALTWLPGLTLLKLGDNDITEKGGRALGFGIRRLPLLRQFDLSRNDVGDIGIESVAAGSAQLGHLETLVLHSCGAVARTTLDAIVKALVDNVNASVVGGIQVLDLQDNAFDSRAIKAFLARCSGLGAPQVIKLGKRRKSRLLMSIENAEAGADQVVDLGLPAFTGERLTSAEATTQGEGKDDTSSQVRVVFGKEIAPHRLVSAMAWLLNLPPGQVRAAEEQQGPSPEGSYQVMICDVDGPSEDLLELFAQGNETLQLLHVIKIEPVLQDPRTTSIVASSSPPPKQQRRGSLLLSSSMSSSVASGALSAQPMGRAGGKEATETLLRLVRQALAEEDLAHLKDQLREVAQAFAQLDAFVPSEDSDLERYLLELDRSQELAPMLSWALGRFVQLSASQVLVVRAYLSAAHGDVERAVASAEQGKYALGLMLSLAQVTQFESATLQAALVAQDVDMFANVMGQDLDDESEAAGGIRLANIIHNDLFARSTAQFLDLSGGPASSLEGETELEETYPGLVTELLSFERLNRKWTPRELQLQFTNRKRRFALSVPVRQAGDEDGSEPESGRFWRSLGDAKVDVAYTEAAGKISELLLQAMSDRHEGFAAAHEAFGIAHSNRAVGLVDELVCQLVCQVTCNPSLRSMDLGWRLLVVALRILRPSKALVQVLLRLLARRTEPERMLQWAQEALESALQYTAKQQRVVRVVAGDPSIRLDLLKQVLSDDDVFEVPVLCANGTGLKLNVSPFTSFGDLLHVVHESSAKYLRREGVAPESSVEADEATLWRDFAFTYSDVTEDDEDTQVMAWTADAHWWRWQLAIQHVLEEREPEAIQLALQQAICAPSTWYFDKHELQHDSLRAELVYWERAAALQRGHLCTSNPEALAYLCCLSAAVRISGGLAQLIALDTASQVRVCMGHLPKAVRRSVGKRPTNPWLQRFAAVVERFSAFFGTKAGALPELATLHCAFVAFLDTFPLAGGQVFRNVRGAGTGYGPRARVVVSAKGLFLLELTHDAHTSRAIALRWWTPLDDITRLQMARPGALLVATRRAGVLELEMPHPRRLYKAVVAHAAANLAVGNPTVPRQLCLLEFAHRFGDHLPAPPPPPPLYDTAGYATFPEVAGDASLLSTISFVLKERLEQQR
ncbi:Protein NLRC5, partial [Durusdinium trenchii]